MSKKIFYLSTADQMKEAPSNLGQTNNFAFIILKSYESLSDHRFFVPFGTRDSQSTANVKTKNQRFTILKLDQASATKPICLELATKMFAKMSWFAPRVNL